jgi:hypothetical protein
LEPELRKVATQDEEEVESSRAKSISVEEPVGRHHAARWVLALWHETDPLARAKAIVCLAAIPGVLDDTHLRGLRWRLETDFADAIRTLPAEQRRKLSDFAKALPELPLLRRSVSDEQLGKASDWALGRL